MTTRIGSKEKRASKEEKKSACTNGARAPLRKTSVNGSERGLIVSTYLRLGTVEPELAAARGLHAGKPTGNGPARLVRFADLSERQIMTTIPVPPR